MNQIPIVDVVEKVGSFYKTVMLVSMRASELNNGAPRLVEANLNQKFSNIALQEINEGKISFKRKPAKEDAN